MLAFLLATGLCVDISHFYLIKTELQNAADSAALAAASGLNSGTNGIVNARVRAMQVMNNYEFNKTGVAIKAEDVTFAVNLGGPYMSEASAANPTTAKNIRFVRVKTPQAPIKVFFAAVVLGASKNISAEATAGMSVPLSSFCDWIPLSVIDYGVAMQPGQTYTIRANSHGSVSPGNYQILAVAGRGGQDVRAGLASGVDLCAEPGAVYEVDTKPGLTSGPVRVGINTRFGDYGAQTNPTDHPPDTNVMENISYYEYANKLRSQAPRQGAPGVDGRRIVLIPIVKLSEYDPGRNTVKFDRFGAFFLRTKVGGGSGGEIVAEYIEDRVVVGRGGLGSSTATGAVTIPVLYK